jgi:UDP-galactopyranose mutase
MYCAECELAATLAKLNSYYPITTKNSTHRLQRAWMKRRREPSTIFGGKA